VIGVGLLGQAVLLLLLVRLGGRRLAVTLTGRRLPPFAQWRLPFYVVWVLVAGIGLMLTRRAPLADAGLNLAVLAAAFLAVQGLAVQYHLSRRFLPPVMLVIYWTLMGLAFVPLVATSVLLGLFDQWRDLRGPVSGGSTAEKQ
jgi:xanthine/uracil permease